MFKYAVFVGTAFFLATQVYCQNMELVGSVTLFNTYPVANLVVSTKKAKTTATTDAEGQFMLLCKEKDVIVIQGKAFQTVNRRVDHRSGPVAINVVFKDTPKNRNLVIDKGYISREELLYGLEHLNAENNDYCAYEDIFTLLKSKFPEVEVKTSSDGGYGVYLRRGTKSLTLDTQMLYIVDGMRLQDISYINPCEISQVKILGEGASAKYGAGSSNGSLEITTKRAERH